MDCVACQDRTLDLAYSLLDAAEAELVRAHVRDCAACQAANAASLNQQELFARAAKFSFDGVTFDRPAETAKPQRMIPSYVWAMAAAVLIAAFVLPSLFRNRGGETPIAKIDQTPPASSTTPPPVVVVNAGGLKEGTPGEWKVEGTGYRVLVMGPEKPGPADFSITAAETSGKPLKVRVNALIKNGETVIKKESFDTDKVWTLTPTLFESLPAGAKLHVLATHAVTGEKLELLVTLK